VTVATEVLDIVAVEVSLAEDVAVLLILLVRVATDEGEDVFVATDDTLAIADFVDVLDSMLERVEVGVGRPDLVGAVDLVEVIEDVEVLVGTELCVDDLV
jgi:hypothetical protein